MSKLFKRFRNKGKPVYVCVFHRRGSALNHFVKTKADTNACVRMLSADRIGLDDFVSTATPVMNYLYNNNDVTFCGFTTSYHSDTKGCSGIYYVYDVEDGVACERVGHLYKIFKCQGQRMLEDAVVRAIDFGDSLT